MKKVNRITVTVSKGEFYRAVEMEYYSLNLTKDHIVLSGDQILLKCKESKVCNVDECLLVREVMDWDSVDYMDDSKNTYSVIIRNPNYRS